MTDTAVLTRTDSATPIRNEPVQARSTARLAALLDAAAHVVDEIGYERLTTAMVAERAGASIGTVYRYFPDRIAVLQSLAARNAERIGEPRSPSSATAATAPGDRPSWRASTCSRRRSAASPDSRRSVSAMCSTCGRSPGCPRCAVSDRAAATMVAALRHGRQRRGQAHPGVGLDARRCDRRRRVPRDPQGDPFILRHAMSAANTL